MHEHNQRDYQQTFSPTVREIVDHLHQLRAIGESPDKSRFILLRQSIDSLSLDDFLKVEGINHAPEVILSSGKLHSICSMIKTRNEIGLLLSKIGQIVSSQYRNSLTTTMIMYEVFTRFIIGLAAEIGAPFNEQEMQLVSQQTEIGFNVLIRLLILTPN